MGEDSGVNSLGDKAVERLYAKRKVQADKQDKAKEDYEFERMGSECTFTPQVRKTTISINSQKKGVRNTVSAYTPNALSSE